MLRSASADPVDVDYWPDTVCDALQRPGPVDFAHDY
jgi:hypothetical protein